MHDFAKKDRQALLSRRSMAGLLASCALCFLVAFLIGFTMAASIPGATHSQSVTGKPASK